MQGLMWSDSNPTKTWLDRIVDAATRYHQKFNHWPTVCYVHPSASPDVAKEVEIGPGRTVRVLPSNMPAFHLLIGHNGTGESDDG